VKSKESNNTIGRNSTSARAAINSSSAKERGTLKVTAKSMSAKVEEATKVTDRSSSAKQRGTLKVTAKSTSVKEKETSKVTVEPTPSKGREKSKTSTRSTVVKGRKAQAIIDKSSSTKEREVPGVTVQSSSSDCGSAEDKYSDIEPDGEDVKVQKPAAKNSLPQRPDQYIDLTSDVDVTESANLPSSSVTNHSAELSSIKSVKSATDVIHAQINSNTVSRLNMKPG